MTSSNNQAPSTTPNKGDIKDNTPNLEAKYKRSNQNQTNMLIKDTNTIWNSKLPIKAVVHVIWVCPIKTAPEAKITKAPTNW